MNNVHRLFDDPPVAAPVGDFEAIWKLWPRKDGKAIARTKYQSIVRGRFQSKTLDKSSGQFVELELSASPEMIEAGINAYIASQIDKRTYRFKDDGKFIPHLATWLGRAGWEDWL